MCSTSALDWTVGVCVCVIYTDRVLVQILEDEVSADFYISVPEMLPKIVPLKNKLRKKFPKSKRGDSSL